MEKELLQANDHIKFLTSLTTEELKTFGKSADALPLPKLNQPVKINTTDHPKAKIL